MIIRDRFGTVSVRTGCDHLTPPSFYRVPLTPCSSMPNSAAHRLLGAYRQLLSSDSRMQARDGYLVLAPGVTSIVEESRICVKLTGRTYKQRLACSYPLGLGL